MTTKGAILLPAFAALALIGHSTTGFSANAQRGQQFVLRVCAVCHVVAVGQARSGLNAPSFRSIAESRQFQKKGSAFLWETHQKMPNLALTQDELDDVAAYIKSLAK